MKPNQIVRAVPVVMWLPVLASLMLCVARERVGADPAQENLLRANLKDQAADFWIYDDLKAGYARARKTGKPLLVSFRCVP